MKKLKSIWMTLLVAALTVAMVIGGFTFTAFADEPTTVTKADIASDVQVVRKVKYGGTFSIPAGSTVKGPDGKALTETDTGELSGTTVTAKQVGVYTVTVGTGGDTYDFTVYSYVEQDYSIKVENNGATIPTYIKKGETFDLPTAKLVYTDEDGKLQEASDTVETTATLNPISNGKYTATNAGTDTVRYAVKLQGGAKVYTKEFTVRVQSTFEDAKAPTLSVVNVPQNININKKVTLPIATASDDFDENVLVTVTVTDPDGAKVKEVDVDENDFASVKENAEEVKFDNSSTMTFYPTKTGEYKVTYVAKDDSGKESAVYSYNMTCSDKSAPVFDKIDEWLIPDKWGVTVKSGEDETVLADSTIKFPDPAKDELKVIDNNGITDVTVSFELKDSKNKTVISFSDILKTDKPIEFTYSDSTYKKVDGGADKVTYADFCKDGFDLDRVGTQITQTGTYTAEYIARDKAGNRTTKRYSIDVASEYTDKNLPKAEIEDAPKYLLLQADNSLTIPTPTVYDEETTRLHVKYELAAGDNKVTVEGGEVFKFNDDSTALVADDKKLVIGNATELTLTLNAKDTVGQAAEEAQETIQIVSSVVVPSINAATLDVSDMKGGAVGKIKGTIEIATAVPQYTGFEFYIENVSGDVATVVPGVSLETYYDKSVGQEKIVIRNISFAPKANNKYRIVVRAFNAFGKGAVASWSFTAGEKDGSGSGTGNPYAKASAVQIPTQGSVYETYTLKNYDRLDDVTVSNAWFARKITGARFSLMADEFTAMNAGTYSIVDGYFVKGTTDGDFQPVEPYAISVTNSKKPVIEVQGTIDTHVDVNEAVSLPSFVAYTEYGNVKTDVKVTDGDGNNVQITNNAFTPKKDGKYTVTVTASYNGVAADPFTYTVSAGDVVAPDFSLSGDQQTSYRLNSTFEFRDIVAVADDSDGKDETEKNDAKAQFTYTKRLIDPSGEEITVSGTGNSYATRKNNGTAITLSKGGAYTVVYEVKDAHGNISTQKFTFNVTDQTKESKVSLTAISTVLIIVGVVLIAGVIVYLVRYRKVKPKDEK